MLPRFRAQLIADKPKLQNLRAEPPKPPKLQLVTVALPGNFLRYLKIKYPELPRSAALRRELTRPKRWRFKTGMSAENVVPVTFRFHEKITSREAMLRIHASAKRCGVDLQVKPFNLKHLPGERNWITVYVPQSVETYLRSRYGMENAHPKFIPRFLRALLLEIDGGTPEFIRTKFQRRPSKSEYWTPDQPPVLARGTTRPVQFRYPRKIRGREVLRIVHQHALAEGVYVEVKREYRDLIF